MTSRSSGPESLPPERETTGAASSETVVVGRVRRAHGIRGEVLVESWSDVADRFDPGQELLVGGERGALERLRVERSRNHGNGWLVSFAGIADRDRAAALAGARIEVERARVPRPPEATYYYFELVGCRCVDATAGDLGTVTDVIEDGGGLLLRIESSGRELLIPFVDAFLETVDVARRRIELRLPPGLVETCTFAS